MIKTADESNKLDDLLELNALEEVWIYRPYSDSDWTCHLKWERDSVKVDIIRRAKSPQQAFDAAVREFTNLANFGLPSLPAPGVREEKTPDPLSEIPY